MSKIHLTGDDFISSVFKPKVVISSSTDANLLCVKNHLTFTELLKPFSAVNKDVILRDNNNISHFIKNLQINFEDISTVSLHPQQVKKLQSEVVSKCFSKTGSNVITMQHGTNEIHVSVNTPWFEAWRQIFVQNMSFSDHEFFDHYLACIFVVSTFNNDVIDQFQRLSQQLTNTQHHGTASSKFFNNNILKYYVLLHDQGQGDQLRAEELFKLVKSTFNGKNCYLLVINSVTTNTLANNENTLSSFSNGNETQTDPWIQFLIPGGNLLSEMVTYNDEAIHNKHNSPNEDSVNMLSHDDPLLLYKSSMDEKDLNFTPKYNFKSGVKYSTSYPQLSSSGNAAFDLLNKDGLLTSSNDSVELNKSKFDIHKPHGQCLTSSDHERIRDFVYEFVSFGLMPWVESTLKQLSEQIAYKLKMTRGFFNVTRKIFGGTTSHVKTNPLNPVPSLSSNLSGSTSNINSTGSMRVIYTPEAIEMQMRRHADLAFLFQQYEVAYQTYNVLKKDFQDDAAWLHYAGSMEMCALSIFLQGNTSQRQYPHHYMESAINIYLSHCRNIDYATRAALLNCEALKSQGVYLQASNQFIKLTADENDLRSALLLEQSAHFYLQIKVPMLRKYAFHMILAGHRFSKAGQKMHTIRCYTQALPIFKGKNWTLAEDHIHATISKHAYYQKQLETALEAYHQLLSKNSRQHPIQQAAHLRDFLKISKEYMESGSDKELLNGSLPEFIIPCLDQQSIKVMLGHPIKSYEEISVEAKDIQFSDNDFSDPDWKDLELSILQITSSKDSTNRPISKNTLKMKNTDKSISIIGEPITVQVYLENPLHIPIVLTDIYLLWEFSPDNSEYADSIFTQSMKYNLKNCPIITNQIDQDNIFEAHEFVGTEIHSDMCLLPKERKSLELSIIPKTLGILKVTGLAFYLNSGSPNQSVNNYFSQSSEYNFENDISELPLIKLKGKLVFNIPQKNISKNNGKLIDNKLKLNVTPQMPKLKVVFSEFPKSMIIDEVARFNITITNIGKEAMKNIVLAIKPHDFLTFGFDEFCHSITNQIYQHSNDVSGISSDILNDKMKSICMGSCRRITLGNDDQLLPGNSLTLPIWIRFHYLSSEKKTIKFLFYYESVCKHPYLSYRLLRHKAEIDLRSNMKFQGQFIRPKGTDNQNFFINMKIENQQHPNENKMTEFEIYQITSISTKWQFDQEFCNKNIKDPIRIGPKETHSVCFKLKPIELNKKKLEKDKQYFSNVIFNNSTYKYVHTSGSPCSDFFYLQYFQNKSGADENLVTGDINNDVKQLILSYWDDICIIILWKAIVNHSNDHKVFHEGQSHIFSSKIDYSNICGDINIIKHSHAKSLFDSNKRLISSDFNLQPLLRYSKIVNIHQKFQQNISHNFKLRKKLIIPVNVTLYNTSSENIVVRLEPFDPPETYSVKISTDSSILTMKSSSNLQNPDLLKINKSSEMFSNVLWIGLSSRQFYMKADSSTEINLKCIVTRPGVYEIQSLTVKAAVKYSSSLNDPCLSDNYNVTDSPDSSALPFIKQENTYSSILIVTQDPIII